MLSRDVFHAYYFLLDVHSQKITKETKHIRSIIWPMCYWGLWEKQRIVMLQPNMRAVRGE